MVIRRSAFLIWAGFLLLTLVERAQLSVLDLPGWTG